jgi:HEPN domain-containing protein
MNRKPQEWLKQADYDLDTAEFMYSGKRYFYAVFMCHLAIEKALKGLYQKNLHQVPPKTHNLIYLLDCVGLKPDEKLGRFIARLNEAHIATRYPEDIDRLQQLYTQPITHSFLEQTREILDWIKRQF